MAYSSIPRNPEDGTVSNADPLVPAAVVRQDTLGASNTADGKYGLLKTSAKDELYVKQTDAVGVTGTFFQATQPVSLATNTPTLQSGSTTAVTQGTATNLKAQAENYQGGTAVGPGNPLQVTLANTGANSIAVKVDGSAVTQPVSGTVAINTTDSAPVTQNITVIDSGSTSVVSNNGQTLVTGSSTAGSVATFSLSSLETVRVQVTGTWTGTITSEISIDGGTTWFAQGLHQGAYTTSTFFGNFVGGGSITGATNFRVRATAAITGTAVVKIIESINTNSVYIANAAPAGTVVSLLNSSTATLTSGSVFTGAGEDVSNFSEMRVSVFANVASATDGLSLQQSSDNTNWDVIDTYTVAASSAGQGKTFVVPRQARYFRVVYTNGGTNQTSFRLQSILNRTATAPSSQRASDGYTNETDLVQNQVFLMGYNGTTWDRLRTLGTGVLSTSTVLTVGSALIGKVGIDQTTPGTTNAVSANQGTAAALTGGWPTINGEAGDVTGTFTNATQTTSVTANSLDGYGNTLISINGTYSTATAIFEGSDDGGTTWYTVQAARDNTNVIETGYTTLTNVSQTWQINNPGFDSLRVRSTAVASGTVNVRLSSSAAPVASGTIVGLGTAIPAGSNVIGHVIADTGSVVAATLSAETTKVIGTVNQGTSPWVTNDPGLPDTLGQKTMANSAGVTLASDQSAVPVSAAVGSPVFVTPTPSTTGGWTYSKKAALSNTNSQVKSGGGTLGGYYIYNPNASVAYVQIYDTATGSITVGTTAAVLSIGIPATSAANLDSTNGINFATAICVAATTTAGGSTAPGTALDCNFWYK